MDNENQKNSYEEIDKLLEMLDEKEKKINSYENMDKSIEMITNIKYKEEAKEAVDKILENISKNNEYKKKYLNSNYNGTYNNLVKNSVKSDYTKKSPASRKKKRITKNRFRKIAMGMMMTSVLITSLNAYYVVSSNKKENALDFMSKSLMVDNVNFTTMDEEQIKVELLNIYENLKAQGYNKNVIMYYIKETFGQAAFDLMAQSIGYKNGDDYVVDKGYKHDEISSSGETVYWSIPKYNEYNRDMQSRMIEDIEEITYKSKGV